MKKDYPEYKHYRNAKSRCECPSSTIYHKYGGVGIKFRFQSFEEFFAEIGPKPSEQHTLDRFPDYGGHYEKGNIRWATPTEQNRNQRSNRQITAFGKTQCLAAWADETGFCWASLWSRFNRRWDAERALTQPMRVKRKVLLLT